MFTKLFSSSYTIALSLISPTFHVHGGVLSLKRSAFLVCVFGCTSTNMNNDVMLFNEDVLECRCALKE